MINVLRVRSIFVVLIILRFSGVVSYPGGVLVRDTSLGHPYKSPVGRPIAEISRFLRSLRRTLRGGRGLRPRGPPSHRMPDGFEPHDSEMCGDGNTVVLKGPSPPDQIDCESSATDIS